MRLLTSLFLTTSLFAGTSYIGGSSKSTTELINYYNDGVYDTISQINKEIEEGVNKEELKDIVGKIAILTPLQNVSTVNLIFYKTTAAKINLFSATTVIDENGTPYMLWDLRQREVDSQFVIEKLTERNIPVTSKTVEENNKFYREPVLIKDFIEKVKNNIKNVDTKVVVVENKAYTNEKIEKFIPIEFKEKTVFKQDLPTNKEYEENKIDTSPKYNEVSFYANTINVSKNLRLGKSDALFYKITKIQKGARIGEFIVSDLRIEETDSYKRYFLSYVEDLNRKEYLLYTLKKQNAQNKIVEKQQLNNVKEKKQIVAQKITSTYKCDFKNIKMALSKDGKPIKIDSSNLYYNKLVTVEAVKKIGTNFLLTNSMGLPEILLSEKYVNSDKYCIKVN